MAVVTDTADERTTGHVPSWADVAVDDALPTRLMVLGLAHRDGTVHGPELYRVAEECGISVETVRSCVRRLSSEGLFERRGEGRDAVFVATAAGRSLL